MNEIFNRMKALLQNAGIKFTEGGISNAEIYAYAAAIKHVWEYLTDALDDVFMQGDSNAERYAALLNIDKNRYTLAELKEEIKDRLAMNFATATIAEHEAAFAAVGSGSYDLYLDSEDYIPRMIFSGVDIEDLPQLAKFIDAYTCSFQRTYYDGSGMTFDDWDTWNQTFWTLDKMALPFNIIDYLRSDMIE
ncbi:MAG: hypothetical protein IJR60_05070 [Eubacterium sp.]|nr:hypothetical protein [Eubacterium sp.]